MTTDELGFQTDFSSSLPGTRLVRSTKIVSPTVGLQLKALGITQVMAILSSAQTVGLATTADRSRLSEVASRLRRHFRTAPNSQSVAIAHALSASASLGVAKKHVREPQPATMFPNLGVMLGTVDAAGLAGLEADPDVALVCGTPQISLIRPGNPKVGGLTGATTWGIDALGAPRLWQEGLTGKGVKVGHLDTGVDGRHSALKAAIAGFAEFDLSTGERITPDPAPHDSDEHGTHTAGTVAGRSVAGKSIGVAPGAELYSGLVIEGGNAVARVLGGLDWAIESGVCIITMSLGFRGWWEDFLPIFRILRSRNILPVIAVGNEGPGTSRSPGNYPEALSVGATDDQLRIASFSSSQRFTRAVEPLVPDVVAPGVNVISAKPGNSYQAMDGTSMATPHIAGLAALLWESKPTAHADEIEAAIFASCTLPSAMNPERANRGFPNGPTAFAKLTGTTLSTGGAKVAVQSATKPTKRKERLPRRPSRKSGRAKK